MKFKPFFCLVILFSFLCAAGTACFAFSDDEDESYPESAGRKLGRGVSNIAFGWLEIPKGIEKARDDHNIIAAVTLGPLQGVGNTVKRMGAGILETVTFPFASADTNALVEPEFVLDEEKEDQI